MEKRAYYDIDINIKYIGANWILNKSAEKNGKMRK